MAGRFFALIAAALAVSASLAFGEPARACSVMVDTSQSMEGFKGSAAFQRVLSQLGRQCDEHYQFGAALGVAPADLNALAFKDGTTKLASSVRAWTTRSRARRLLVLTDNVIDEGDGRQDIEQQQFYDLLRSPQMGFSRIAAMLIRLPFDGAVYSADGKGRGQYSGGSRALMLYVIERAGEGAPEPALNPAAFGLSPSDLAVVSLRPFESVGELQASALESTQRNVTLEDGVVTLARASAGSAYAFTLRTRIKGTGRWSLAGWPLAARLVFPANPPFASEAASPCTITPATAPDLSKPFAADIACTAPSALDSLDEAAIKRLGNRRGERGGWLEVRAVGRGADLKMGPQLAAWSFDGDGARLAAPDSRVQGSIYRLGSLLAGMSPQEISPVVMRTPIVEKLYFFDAKPFLWTALALAALAAAGLVAVGVARPRTVELTGGVEGFVTRVVRGLGRIETRVGDFERAAIWVLPGLMFVAGRAAKPKFLPAGGGDCMVGLAGRRLSVRVRRTTVATAERRAPPVRRR